MNRNDESDRATIGAPIALASQLSPLSSQLSPLDSIAPTREKKRPMLVGRFR